MRMEHRCPQCASARLTLVRDFAFAVEWQCATCARVFANPLLSVVLIDPVDRRRRELSAALERERIPVFAAARLAELPEWPVGKVLVTDVVSLPSFETGAAHLVVMAESDDECWDIELATGGRASVINGNAHALLRTLRRIVAAHSAAMSSKAPRERRSGPADRRRFTRRDRRS